MRGYGDGGWGHGAGGLCCSACRMPPHERLDVYRVAVEFHAIAWRELRGRGSNDAQQLLRASAAVQNNIAEAAIETRPRERARIFRIALRESAECHATLARIQATEPIAEAAFNNGRRLLYRVIRMLKRLAESANR